MHRQGHDRSAMAFEDLPLLPAGRIPDTNRAILGAANQGPSGVMARLSIAASRAGLVPSVLPVSALHHLSLPSSPPLASFFPSGVNTRAVTRPSDPSRVEPTVRADQSQS